MITPKISLNKLGEYVQLKNPLRRQQIVYDSKYPPNFKTTRYKEAREFIRNYIINGYDESILQTGIDLITKKPARNPYQQGDNTHSIFSLQLIGDSDLPDLSDFNIEIFDGEDKYLKINGVRVSVNPDLILSKEIKGKKVYGGIKIHIIKTFSLDEEGQKTVATVLKDFIEKNIQGNNDTTDLRYCFSIDVFRQSCIPAPKSFSQRMKQVESACTEIALWWAKTTKKVKKS